MSQYGGGNAEWVRDVAMTDPVAVALADTPEPGGP